MCVGGWARKKIFTSPDFPAFFCFLVGGLILFKISSCCLQLLSKDGLFEFLWAWEMVAFSATCARLKKILSWNLFFPLALYIAGGKWFHLPWRNSWDYFPKNLRLLTLSCIPMCQCHCSALPWPSGLYHHLSWCPVCTSPETRRGYLCDNAWRWL